MDLMGIPDNPTKVIMVLYNSQGINGIPSKEKSKIKALIDRAAKLTNTVMAWPEK